MNDDVFAEMGGTTLRGTVGLGCPEDYSIAFLPRLLAGFCAEHPEVELSLACAPTVELRPLLDRHQIDLALVSLGNAKDGAVIREESFVWVANAAKPALLDRPIVPLALSAPATLDYRAALVAMEIAGRRYRVAFASSSLAGLIAIARSGHAISVLTRTAVPHDLHIVSTGLPPLPTIGIAVELSARRPSAAVTALGQHIREVLPSL